MLDRLNAFLDSRRLLAYAALLLVAEIAMSAYFVAASYNVFHNQTAPVTTDFASFYAAGVLADAGTPALAYHQPEHFAAEQRVREPGIAYNYFFYPPVFLALCALLAYLPYVPAFLLFEVSSLALYLLATTRILGRPARETLIPLLAFPIVFWNFGWGQNAFLTAALFGAATLLIDRRPVIAGLCFGALCYKPHFGLLIPVALAAGRYWRAFAAAALSALLVVGLSVALFGIDTWQSFLTVASGSYATYESGRIDFAGFVSPFGAVRLLGGGPAFAYLVQTSTTIVVAGLIAFIWRKGLSLPVRAASLATGTLLAIPVVLLYDLMTAFIAMLWLVRAAQSGGYRPWQKAGFGFVFIVPIFSRTFGTAFHLPLAPLATLVLFALVLDSARRELAQHRG